MDDRTIEALASGDDDPVGRTMSPLQMAAANRIAELEARVAELEAELRKIAAGQVMGNGSVGGPLPNSHHIARAALRFSQHANN